MAGLELRNIVKRYKGKTVIGDVSLDVEDGHTVVLFGPSGSGKSVLLRLIAGVIEPEQGRILIGGDDVTDLDAEHRGIGMAFQNFALFPHMTAFDNIASPLVAKRPGPGEIEAAVQNVAKLLKIDHVLDHMPKALSNGQKQRTALARALVGEPPVLLLDDPLRNVDAKLRFEMRLELPRLLSGRGATVVYVTQDYKEAMALGDRIAVMTEGRIAQFGTPEQIYLQPANIEIARLFGDPAINLLDVVPSQDGRGLFVSLSNAQIYLPAALRAGAGRACVLGIRPEAITFADPAAPGAVPVTVEAVMPLNEKTVTLVRTVRKREILISRPAGSPAPGEGQAFISINSDAVLLFNRETGERIGVDNTVPFRKGQAA